jgi:hypothetical protein
MSFGHGAIVLGAGEGKTISVLGDSYTYKAANVRALRCRAFVLTCCRRDRGLQAPKNKDRLAAVSNNAFSATPGLAYSPRTFPPV